MSKPCCRFTLGVCKYFLVHSFLSIKFLISLLSWIVVNNVEIHNLEILSGEVNECPKLKIHSSISSQISTGFNLAMNRSNSLHIAKPVESSLQLTGTTFELDDRKQPLVKNEVESHGTRFLRVSFHIWKDCKYFLREWNRKQSCRRSDVVDCFILWPRPTLNLFGSCRMCHTDCKFTFQKRYGC